MSLTQASETYYPIYPEFVAITEEHEKSHWGTWEVSLKDDVMQWQTGAIPEKTKAFIKTILRIFTEGDRIVGADYYDHLIPVFKNNEVRNMLGSFANREGTHQRAYALLNDTLGFGKDFYTEFKQYQQMQEKLEFMQDLNHGSMRDIALSLGKQCYIEGVALFASFAMLLNFGRQGILPGMTDVNTWSIKDETLHVQGNAMLFRKFLEQHPRIVNDEFKKELYNTCRKCVELEDSFIDLTFDTGAVEGITREEVKQYIRAVADFRSVQLGLKQQYNVSNPFDWLDWITSSTGMENFFEVNTTNYSKGSMQGEYDNAYLTYSKVTKPWAAVVWSKNNCPYCTNAKALLIQQGIRFLEKNVDDGFTREQFFNANPNAKTFPQVWIGEEHIGGYTELVTYLKKVLSEFTNSNVNVVMIDVDAQKVPATNIQDVVDYIIDQFADEDGGLSILKLQKLLYYVQAWHLAFGRVPLFAGRFQAWVHGPMNRQVYDRFKDTHSLFATVSRESIRQGFDANALPSEARDHIDEILEAYGQFSGVQLENMTHEEAPWLEARGNLKSFERCENELNEKTMQEFFAKLLQEDTQTSH